MCVCVCVCVFSRVWLFATPRTVACQAPLSMGFPRQEYWIGLPFLSPGDLPDPGIKADHKQILYWDTREAPRKIIGVPKGRWTLKIQRYASSSNHQVSTLSDYFPKAAVTVQLTRRFKTTEMFSLVVLEVRNLKPRCQQGYDPSECSREIFILVSSSLWWFLVVFNF